MSYAIIKCGSAARGDTNECSDVDYVCIHDGHNVSIKSLKLQYPGISFLSLESIRRMKLKGALFLVHLEVDGCFVEGDPILLSAISGFRPRRDDLEKSIETSVKFIQGIEWFPDSYTGELWLLDTLFVSLRNIIYCKNALKSVYCFGLLDAVEAYGMNDHEQEVIFRIRQGKYAFRSSSTQEKITKMISLEHLSKIASKISNSPVAFARGGATDWDREWAYDYWEERLIERAIINQEVEDNGFRARLTDHNYNRRKLSEDVKRYVSEAKLAKAGLLRPND